MKRARGFTIAETLVVAVILGLMLTAIAGAIAPLLSSPASAQAKTESLGPMSSGLWVLQRDVREGAAVATFACDGYPPQCGDGVPDVTASALAVPTARASGALDAPLLTDESAGTPAWDGFMVYRMSPQGDELDRTFVDSPTLADEMAVSPPDRARLAIIAGDAVLTARQLKPDLVIHDIASVAAAIDQANGVTSLHIVALGSSGGHTNTTTFDDAILSRN